MCKGGGGGWNRNKDINKEKNQGSRDGDRGYKILITNKLKPRPIMFISSAAIKSQPFNTVNTV